ncbi:hypothetical protein MLD38_017343 [Melastoma candidum]|uniref:Uncharacterized protein n=1 Tax=Melastoma candidum TaxID=119954 RepID=A0ACB9QS83_9MYRT|nr:hypothetical protein MLD38_017343 [Melastoma candidum]
MSAANCRVSLASSSSQVNTPSQRIDSALCPFLLRFLVKLLLVSPTLLLGLFGVGGRLGRLLGLRAPAPAFVFFSIVYVLAVYFVLPGKGIFFLWHLYCICFNVKTEKRVNWEKYPEFQLMIDTERSLLE